MLHRAGGTGLRRLARGLVCRAMVLGAFALMGLPAALPAKHANAATGPQDAALINDDGSEFALASNATWRLATGAPVKVVHHGLPADPKSDQPLDRQGLDYTWAPTCQTGRQEVRMVRTAYVPGPLYSLGVYVHPSAEFPGGMGSFSTIEVLINGHRVLRTNGSEGGYDPTHSYGGKLRFGDNRFELHVIKNAETGQKPPPCNVGAAPASFLGVKVKFMGEFAPDLGG